MGSKTIFKGKKVVGLIEKVVVKGSKGEFKSKALFDTGATRTSIDVKLAAKAGLGPIVGVVKVKSATNPQGFKIRPVAMGTLIIKGKEIYTRMNIEDRSGLTCKVLIGRDLIHSNFLVDVEKTHKTYKIDDVKNPKEKKG